MKCLSSEQSQIVIIQRELILIILQSKHLQALDNLTNKILSKRLKCEIKKTIIN